MATEPLHHDGSLSKGLSNIMRSTLSNTCDTVYHLVRCQTVRASNDSVLPEVINLYNETNVFTVTIGMQ